MGSRNDERPMHHAKHPRGCEDAVKVKKVACAVEPLAPDHAEPLAVVEAPRRWRHSHIVRHAGTVFDG